MRNPAELLQSSTTEAALNQIEERYAPDLMIFDLPPTQAGDDVMAFVHRVDCVLIIAAAGTTTIDEVDHCERELGGADQRDGRGAEQVPLPRHVGRATTTITEQDPWMKCRRAGKPRPFAYSEIGRSGLLAATQSGQTGHRAQQQDTACGNRDRSKFVVDRGEGIVANTIISQSYCWRLWRSTLKVREETLKSLLSRAAK